MENNNIQNNSNTPSKNPKTFLKWALITSIVILLNMFFNYALSLVYKAPVYDQFVKPPQVVETLDTQEKCLSVGGQWSPNTYIEKDISTNIKQPSGYCDSEYTKRNNYEEARKTYEKNVFVTLIVLGVLVLGISFFVVSAILSIAFSWGGVLSIIIASVRYWSVADNLLKVIILAVALVALIYLAIKKFDK